MTPRISLPPNQTYRDLIKRYSVGQFAQGVGGTWIDPDEGIRLTLSSDQVFGPTIPFSAYQDFEGATGGSDYSKLFVSIQRGQRAKSLTIDEIGVYCDPDIAWDQNSTIVYIPNHTTTVTPGHPNPLTPGVDLDNAFNTYSQQSSAASGGPHLMTIPPFLAAGGRQGMYRFVPPYPLTLLAVPGQSPAFAMDFYGDRPGSSDLLLLEVVGRVELP